MTLKLWQKISLMMLAIGVLPMSILGLIAVLNGSNSISDQAFARLDAVRDIKAASIDAHFKRSRSLIKQAAHTPIVQQAMVEFSQYYYQYQQDVAKSADDIPRLREELKTYYQSQFGEKYRRDTEKAADIEQLLGGISDNAVLLQHQYIFSNPNPLGEKHLLSQASDSSIYTQKHGEYHAYFRALLEEYGYYDIFLVDLVEGNIVYSVFKELDYATSLLTGPYSSTNFAAAYRYAVASEQVGTVYTEDFQPYTPSYEAPASFMSVPIYHSGRKVGVLIFQMPIEPINDIMGNRSGMGDTGETYLVGEDRLMRSDSYLDPNGHSVSASFAHPETGQVDTLAVDRAFDDAIGSDIIIDYNGNPVLSSYKLIDLVDFQWAILAEIDEVEAFAPVYKLQKQAVVIAVVAVAIILLVAYLASNSIAKPIAVLANTIRDVQGKGDFSIKTENRKNDEVGRTSQAFDSLTMALSQAFREVNTTLKFMAQGQFEHQVAGRYAGEIAELQQGVNRAVADIKAVNAESDQQRQLAQERAQKAAQSEQAIRLESIENSRIKQALDDCQAQIMLADVDGCIIYLNNSFRLLLQKRLRNIQGDLKLDKGKDLVGEKLSIFNQGDCDVLRTCQLAQRPSTLDYQVAGLTFKLAISPIFTEDKQKTGIVIEWQDLTDELAQAEKERLVAERNAYIKQALDTCQANVLVTDNTLTATYANNALLELLKTQAEAMQAKFDLTANTVVGKNVANLFADTQLSGQLANLKSSVSTRIESPELVLDLLLSPVLDEQRNTSAIVIEMRDRTRELAALAEERAVAQTNEQIKQALDNSQACVTLVSDQGQVVYANQAMQRLLQQRREKWLDGVPSLPQADAVGAPIECFLPSTTNARQWLEGLSRQDQIQVPIGELEFELSASPVDNQEQQRIGTVLEWHDLTEQLAQQRAEKARSQENQRVRQALDSVGTNTMIADARDRIIYANHAMRQILVDAEKDIQSIHPHFDARRFLDTDINLFLPEQSPLNQLTRSWTTQQAMAGRTFVISANPIIDSDNTRIGTVVEWIDRTKEIAIEEEVDTIVEAASKGDLSKRIDTQNKQGFFANLSGGLNTLLGTCDNAVMEMVSMLDAMSKGDLSQRITGEYQGAFGKLKEDANLTASKLTEIITQVLQASSEVNAGAYDIAGRNQELSDRTEQQASSLQQTSASMQHITQTVKDNEHSAGQCNSLSNTAQQTAQSGGEVVQRAIQAMEEINQASKKIVDIIGVIDEIAFQTNLLALNASVEAARAGDQGRGFAVVATEVRVLAQRSAEAAKQISLLIHDSVEKVEGGTELVAQSGRSLDDIIQGIVEVSNMLMDITRASTAQTAEILQINSGIEHMDTMTQENAALVEQISSLGTGMASQAGTMEQLLSFFQIETEQA